MPPEDPFGLSFIPQGIWSQDYQGMGGRNIQDMLQQQEAARAQQAQAAQQAEAQQQAQEQAAREAQQQAQYAEAQKNFVDWPGFQKLAEGTEATKQYDGYLEALAWQLGQMGYAPEETSQAVAQFQQKVPRPAEDYGFFGNLAASAVGGMASGTRAVEAAAAAGMGDSEALAKLGAASAGASRNAALTRFQQALGNEEPAGGWEVIDRIASAGVREPVGMLNFFVEQLAQSYPVMASSLGLGAAGSLAGPVGTVAGVAGGAAAGSTALDAGSTILEGLVQEAAARGVDPNNKDALLALLQEPGVKDKIVQGGLAHGIPVGLMDGAIAALSFGVGASVARSVRAGSKLTAGAKAVGGLGLDVGLSAGGEALGQINQSGSITDPMGVGLEALGSLGPGAAGMVGGGVVDTARAGLRRPAVPGAPPIEPTLTESDLPGGAPAVDPFNRTSLTDAAMRIEPTLTAAVAEAEQKLAQVQVEELPMEEIDLKALAEEAPVQPATVENIDITANNVGIAGLLPAPSTIPGAQNPTLAVTPEGVVAPPDVLQAERDKQRLAALAPQVGSVDPNDLESLLDRMLNRGIAIEPDSDLHLALDLVATAPKAMKQEAIASAIEGLGNSTSPDADAVSLELIRIAHQLQPRKAPTLEETKASVAQVAQELGVTPEQVLPVITQALAQEIVDAVVTSQQTQAAGAATATSAIIPLDTPVQAKRGLRRGEAIPGANLADLVSQLAPGGLKQGAGRAQKVQGKSRRGLRPGVTAQGDVTRGGAGPAVVGTNPSDVGKIPNDTTGISAVPNRGLKEAPAQVRKRGIDLAVMPKDEYEKTYPGRNYDDDLDGVLEAKAAGWDAVDSGTPQISPSALRTIQMSPFGSVMNYLASVMENPLQRSIAAHIESLGLDTPITLGVLPGSQSGGYRVEAAHAGQKEEIRIDPSKATLKTVLHEAVHAATIASYRNPTTFEQQLAAKRMDELYEHVLQQHPESVDTHYGMKNTEEFIAEAFSNPTFQKFLNSIDVPAKPKTSLWQAFKTFVMGLLGTKSTALSEALLHGIDLFTNRKSETAVDVAEHQGATVPSTAIVGLKDGVRSFIAYRKSKEDPNSTYTLYPVTPEQPRGDASAKLNALTRQQVEDHIRNAGSEVLPPVADTQPTPGTPKNSSTKLVGFDPNGDLRVAAFEQKDGSWTYYESTSDVRTDPNATVYKNLTKDQAQRYISAKGVQPVQPKPNAVKPAGLRATAIGYDSPSNFGVTFANAEEALIAVDKAQEAAGVPISERVGIAAIRRNSQVEQKTEQVHQQYVEPARKAGEQISKQFNKTQEHIEETLRNMHLIERSHNKIRQFQRGNMDAAKMATKINEQNKKIADAEKYLRDLSNPQYIGAIKDDLAPKMKALSDNTVDMAAQYGLVSRDTAENIKRAYDYYVPLQVGERTTTGKAATGTASTGDLSFARLQEQAYRTIARGEQNKIRDMVARLAETTGLVDNKDPSKSVVTVGSTVVTRYDPETNSLNEGVNNRVFDDDTIVIYRDGNRIPMSTTDPSILEALHPYKGIDRLTALTTLLAITGFATKTIAIGKTALAPMFSPFNLMRDTSTAWINMPPKVSKVKFTQQVMNPETMYSSFKNVFREASGMGGFTGRFAKADKAAAFVSRRAYVGLDVLASNANAEFRPTTWNRLKRIAGVNSRGGSVFKLATAWSQALESATRYAVYKAAIESGLSEEEAGVAGKTASVNFENRGVKNVSPLYMFANAKIQGLRALNESRKQHTTAEVATFTASLIGLGLMAGFLGYKYSEKDRDGKSKYLKIPDYKKDSLVLYKEGSYGMPLPQEVASFYVIGNALADGIWGDKPWGAVGSRIFTSMVNTLWPGNVPQSDVVGHKARPVEFMLRSVVPTALMPTVDFATNRNTWGSPIVSNLEQKKEMGVPGYAMGSANESTLAVNTAKGMYEGTKGVIDVAPQQLVYLNRYLNPTAEATLFFQDLLGNREPKYEGDIVNPIERKFTGKATVFYDQDQFDELLSKAKQAKYQATQRGISTLSIEDQALAKSADMLNRVESDTKQLFKNSKLMTRERVNQLNDRKRELLLDGIRRYNELRDRMPKQ